MTQQLIGAIISALIILGGMYAIVRNLFVFLVDEVRGHPGKAWYDRPYLFRMLAWAFSLLWLFGPYEALNLGDEGRRLATYAAYVLSAASWLWVARVSFLDGIPQHLFHLRTRQTKEMSWHSLAGLTYLGQVLFAAAFGALFIFITADSTFVEVIVRVAAFVFLIGTAFMSLLRMDYLTGVDHSFTESMQHVIGGRDAGQTH